MAIIPNNRSKESGLDPATRAPIKTQTTPRMIISGRINLKKPYILPDKLSIKMGIYLL